MEVTILTITERDKCCGYPLFTDEEAVVKTEVLREMK